MQLFRGPLKLLASVRSSGARAHPNTHGQKLLVPTVTARVEKQDGHGLTVNVFAVTSLRCSGRVCVCVCVYLRLLVAPLHHHVWMVASLAALSEEQRQKQLSERSRDGPKTLFSFAFQLYHMVSLRPMSPRDASVSRLFLNVNQTPLAVPFALLSLFKWRPLSPWQRVDLTPSAKHRFGIYC